MSRSLGDLEAHYIGALAEPEISGPVTEKQIARAQEGINSMSNIIDMIGMRNIIGYIKEGSLIYLVFLYMYRYPQAVFTAEQTCRGSFFFYLTTPFRFRNVSASP